MSDLDTLIAYQLTHEPTGRTGGCGGCGCLLIVAIAMLALIIGLGRG